MKSFEDTHNGKQSIIDVSFDVRRQQLHEANCNAIIDCVLLCGKQNAAFWWHDDLNSS